MTSVFYDLKEINMTKEEILTRALNNRCKYESSKEMDYDAHLSIMDAMGAYAHEQIEKYKEFMKWWFTNGLMEFAIESFSEPTLFIKFSEGSNKKYTLDELFDYWINNKTKQNGEIKHIEP